MRVEVAPARRARHAHDQQRHLLVLVEQAAALAVAQRLLGQGAGIDLAHGIEQVGEPLLARPLIDAEHAVVLAGEGVAIAVFQPRTGTHDEGPLAEVIEHGLELAQRRRGEAPGEDAGAGALLAIQPLQETIRLALAPAHPPQAVVHEEGVEHLGADIERVVRFQAREQRRRVAPHHGARKQHAGRLAADGANADHARAHGEQVVERQVARDQALQAGLLGEQQAGKAGEPLRLGCGVGRPRVAQRRHRARGVEELLPVAADVLVLQPRPARPGEDLGHRAAVGHRAEAVARLPRVDQVHDRSRAVLHLDRPDVQALAAAEDVEQVLRGVGDHVHAGTRVAITQHAEVGHRVEVEEPRAGEAEEVAEHAVGLPRVRQVRQAVEDVQRLGPGRLDHRMHLVDKGVEAVFGPRGVDLRPTLVCNQRRMGGEAKIDQPALLAARRRRVGQHQGAIVLERLDLPDDVVARRHPAQHRIEARQAGGGGKAAGLGRVGSVHAVTLARRCRLEQR